MDVRIFFFFRNRQKSISKKKENPYSRHKLFQSFCIMSLYFATSRESNFRTPIYLVASRNYIWTYGFFFILEIDLWKIENICPYVFLLPECAGSRNTYGHTDFLFFRHRHTENRHRDSFAATNVFVSSTYVCDIKSVLPFGLFCACLLILHTN